MKKRNSNSPIARRRAIKVAAIIADRNRGRPKRLLGYRRGAGISAAHSPDACDDNRPPLPKLARKFMRGGKAFKKMRKEHNKRAVQRIVGDFKSFEETKAELETIYDHKIRRFSGKHHVRYVEPGVPLHIISRVAQGRFMLRPTPELLDIAHGVIGRALWVYRDNDVTLYAAAFMSNHIHLMVSGDARYVARFIAYIKRELSNRWGNRKDVNWPGPMWEEYIATALTTPESQRACLRYILSHGVKEKIVERSEDWPGVHAARTLRSGVAEVGRWLEGTLFGRKRDVENRKKNPQPVDRDEYYKEYEVDYAPIPAYSHLTAEEYRGWIGEMLDGIAAEWREMRGGKPVLGVKYVLSISLKHRSDLPPPPWFEQRKRLICWADPRAPETREYIDRYWAHQRAHAAASKTYCAGDRTVVFPPSSFRPLVYEPPPADEALADAA